MKIIGMIILLIGCFILWQDFELKKFRITSYEYQTDKITQSVNFAVVADLHAHVYGRDNDILIQKDQRTKTGYDSGSGRYDREPLSGDL